MRRAARRALLTFGLVAATALPGSLAVDSASAVSIAATPRVVANHLIDSRNDRIWIPYGVNWPSFEYACIQGWGYSGSGDTAAAAAAMTSWGINTVRLPLNEDCWLGTMTWSGGRTTAGYRSAVESWVGTLNSVGIVVILDLHWSSPTAGQSTGQRAMADSRSLNFWASVAARFSSNPSVMFDVFNEPYSRWNDTTGSWAFQHTWACWRDGDCTAPTADDSSPVTMSTYQTVGMVDLVAAVRDAGASQPIMLAGLDYANDLSGWFANRPDDDQLIAAWHAYKTQACQSACRESVIAPLATKVPVFIGEFGQTDGAHDYFDALMSWADAHSIGYAPWAWWAVDATESVSASRYALITNESTFTPKAPAGTSYHDHLAKPAIDSSSSTGKFAAHQTGRSTLTITGWALNPSTTAAVILRVRVDKKTVVATAVHDWSTPADPPLSRGTPDVFTVVVSHLRTGKHTVCVSVSLPQQSLSTIARWRELGCSTYRTR
jgi:hypothetical protein